MKKILSGILAVMLVLTLSASITSNPGLASATLTNANMVQVVGGTTNCGVTVGVALAIGAAWIGGIGIALASAGAGAGAVIGAYALSVGLIGTAANCG